MLLLSTSTVAYSSLDTSIKESPARIQFEYLPPMLAWISKNKILQPKASIMLTGYSEFNERDFMEIANQSGSAIYLSTGFDFYFRLNRSKPKVSLDIYFPFSDVPSLILSKQKSIFSIRANIGLK